VKSTYTSHRHSHRTANVRVCMRDGRRPMRCAVVVVLVVVQCLEFCCQRRSRRHWTESCPSAPALGSAAPAATRGREVKSDWRDRGYRMNMH